MLANNFKTPAELYISSAQFDALFKVLGMLEREEIPAGMFTMEAIGNPGCGTPGCVYGWARTVGFERPRPFPFNLSRLFFPGDGDRSVTTSAYDATRAQAAVALRNYLTHGEPRWQEAMA